MCVAAYTIRHLYTLFEMPKTSTLDTLVIYSTLSTYVSICYRNYCGFSYDRTNADINIVLVLVGGTAVVRYSKGAVYILM